MSADMPSATERLLDRITFLRLALYEFGLREHYDELSHWNTCPALKAPPDIPGVKAPPAICDCGADKHNAKVLAVLKADAGGYEE